MLIGEDTERCVSRKTALAQALSQARHGDPDPSGVRMLIFSGKRGLVQEFAPKTTKSRRAEEMPDTELAYLREGGTQGRYPSRDGEMFQLDALDNLLISVIDSVSSPPDPDEIRIEMVGPQGTCQNCAEALRMKVHQLQQVSDEYSLKLKFSLITRWTGAQLSFNKNGKRYGTENASASNGPKIPIPWRGAKYSLDAPHWKRKR